MKAICINNQFYNNLLIEGKEYDIKESIMSSVLKSSVFYVNVQGESGFVGDIFENRFEFKGINTMDIAAAYVGQSVRWIDIANWPYSPAITHHMPMIGDIDTITEIQSHSVKVASQGDKWFFAIRFDTMQLGIGINAPITSQQYDPNLDIMIDEDVEGNIKDSLIEQRKELKKFLLG